MIGGNSFTTGDVSSLNWIRNLRLPNGKPPRLDLYGHNPFSTVGRCLDRPPLGHGFADFSDLDLLARWVDRWLARPARQEADQLLPLRALLADRPRQSRVQLLGDAQDGGELAHGRAADHAALVAHLHARLVRALRRPAERRRATR